ncbi:hypothetical protein FNF31_00340 [Cafeteria roenbergensis]|uniref:SEC7 domain-containing protein n=1 Tax=Cafeteria roenbergensis TaxID=33653 RepID=A0A5A8DT38_CAFRO|nr:hypothetical protein FNF31_00340 [Cafeteria roenbergensis]
MLSNAVSCVKGEVHNVVSMLRLSGRWGSSSRFEREVPLEAESVLMREFKGVQDGLQGIQDLGSVDCLWYLKPFLETIVSEQASGPITGTALASVNKFLLYGFLRPEAPRAREAIVAVARAATRCKFESSSVREDETTLIQILEILRNCIRCPAGPLLTDEAVWDMCGSAFRISRFENASHLLHRSAESTLAHLVLTIFTRVPDIADEVEDREAADAAAAAAAPAPLVAVGGGGGGGGAAGGGAAGGGAAAPAAEELAGPAGPAAPPARPRATPSRAQPAGSTGKADSTVWKSLDLASVPRREAPYGERALVKLLSWLSSLTEPASQPAHTRVLGLRLVNMVLESAGADMGRLPALVHVATAELCRNLVQNSRTTEPAVLALTFRVVYSLFASLTPYLKVPLEVFFVSVHLSLADSRDAPPENRELALEALIEFARDGELMADIFVNYDCGVRCSNLFEILTGTLARNAVPGPGERLNSLHVLALEGVLAVLESLARRCELAARVRAGSLPLDAASEAADSVGDGEHSECGGASTPFGAAAASVASRDVVALRERRQLKRRFALAAARFNAEGGSHDEGESGWLRYAHELGVLPVPESSLPPTFGAGPGSCPAPLAPAEGSDDAAVTALDGEISPADVAQFLRTCPGLDRGFIGQYIASNLDRRKPRTIFQTEVRRHFVSSFDFRGLPIVTALRTFLEAFRLPGEAQMIERLMEDFAAHLFEQAPGDYADKDAIFVFSFSIIMLTTDAHNDQVTKKMTLQDFVRNNRGINGGNNLPESLIAEVYADIQNRPLSLHADAAERGFA